MVLLEYQLLIGVIEINIRFLIYSDDEKNDINFLPSIIIRSPGFPKNHQIISVL